MSSPDLASTPGASSLAALSDDELVTRARGNDVAAFEELVGRHEEKIYRLAMRFTRNFSSAGSRCSPAAMASRFASGIFPWLRSSSAENDG